MKETTPFHFPAIRPAFANLDDGDYQKLEQAALTYYRLGPNGCSGLIVNIFNGNMLKINRQIRLVTDTARVPDTTTTRALIGAVNLVAFGNPNINDAMESLKKKLDTKRPLNKGSLPYFNLALLMLNSAFTVRQERRSESERLLLT